jgi:hypothetical protein
MGKCEGLDRQSVRHVALPGACFMLISCLTCTPWLWRWRRHVPLKCQLTLTGLRSITSSLAVKPPLKVSTALRKILNAGNSALRLLTWDHWNWI